MSAIYVCPLSHLDETLTASRADHMVSLMSPRKAISKPAQITQDYLALEFNDIGEATEGLIAPNEDHVLQIVELAKRWNGEGNLLIHCWFGVSRSTAATLIAVASLQPERTTSWLAERLRTLSPIATPNPMMIAHGDKVLGFNGELIKAVAAIGRGAEASQGEPFIWDVNP